MAPQTSLFKVFSVGQITSIKCCPHAAQQRKEKKGKEQGGDETTREEQKLNHAEIVEFGRSFLNALSPTHIHTHSVTRHGRPPGSFSI